MFLQMFKTKVNTRSLCPHARLRPPQAALIYVNEQQQVIEQAFFTGSWAGPAIFGWQFVTQKHDVVCAGFVSQTDASSGWGLNAPDGNLQAGQQDMCISYFKEPNLIVSSWILDLGDSSNSCHLQHSDPGVLRKPE